MNDAFYEQIVPRKSRPKDTVIRILVIVLVAAVMILATPFLGFLAVIVSVVLAALAYYFIFPKLNVEYEYTLLNHDLQVDAIYSKIKRKKLFSFDIQQAEIMAPKGSSRLASYHPDKTLDFTSQDSTANAYVLMAPLDQKNTCIIIEPDANMLKHMRSWMGSKFNMN